MATAEPKLTIQQIARSENLSDETVRRWIKKNLLPAIEYPGTGKQKNYRIDPEVWAEFQKHYRTNSKKM